MGAAPGTLHANPDAQKTKLSLVAFNRDVLTEKTEVTLKQLDRAQYKGHTLWVEVEGLGDILLLEQVGKIFGIHALTLEDIINVRQRAKVEDFPNYQFIVLRIMAYDGAPHSLQMSLVLGEGFVLSFKEQADAFFSSVKERIRKGNPRIRNAGADYLAYSLIDALVDRYFPILEDVGERVEALQQEVLLRPDRDSARKITSVKRDLLTLRRVIWPLRDSLNALMRTGTFIRPETITYLRDAHDHALMLIDLLETSREVAGGLMDLYLSSVSHRMNEVMKVLTVISTIFIPLTFITGLYGMNFNTAASPYNMPELEAYWGYPMVMGIMTALGIAISLFMWRLGWFKSTLVIAPDDGATSDSNTTTR